MASDDPQGHDGDACVVPHASQGDAPRNGARAGCRLNRMRARMLEAMALARTAADWAEAPTGQHPSCPDCGQPVQLRGTDPRILQTHGGQERILTRRSGTCPACGAGLFPPRYRTRPAARQPDPATPGSPRPAQHAHPLLRESELGTGLGYRRTHACGYGTAAHRSGRGRGRARGPRTYRSGAPTGYARTRSAASSAGAVGTAGHSVTVVGCTRGKATPSLETRLERAPPARTCRCRLRAELYVAPGCKGRLWYSEDAPPTGAILPWKWAKWSFSRATQPLASLQLRQSSRLLYRLGWRTAS